MLDKIIEAMETRLLKKIQDPNHRSDYLENEVESYLRLAYLKQHNREDVIVPETKEEE